MPNWPRREPYFSSTRVLDQTNRLTESVIKIAFDLIL